MYAPPDQSRAVQLGYSFTPAQLPPPPELLEELEELELELVELELELDEELDELELDELEDELDELELEELELEELELLLSHSTPPELHGP